MNEAILVIHEMNAHKVLVFDELPKVVKDALGTLTVLDKPELAFSNLDSLVWLEQVVLHVDLVD